MFTGFIPPRARARCGVYCLGPTASGGTCASVGSGASAGVGSGSASSGVVGSGGSAPASALTQAQAPGLEIRARILHPGDLLRATHMPQNFFNIITLNEEGLCLYWNFARHPSFPSKSKLVVSGYIEEDVCHRYRAAAVLTRRRPFSESRLPYIILKRRFGKPHRKKQLV